MKRDLLVILAVLVGFELAVRGLAPSYIGHLDDREHTAGHPIAVTSDGFRGMALPRAKASGETRVLCLGDSVSFGLGAPVEDVWPEQLADQLGPNGTTVNTALPAASVGQMIAALEGPWAGWNEDARVIVVTGNMISLAWMRQDETPVPPWNPYVLARPVETGVRASMTRSRREVKKLAFPSFLSFNLERALYWLGLRDHLVDPASPMGPLLAHGWRQGGLDRVNADDAWMAFERELRTLRDAGGDLPLIVAWSPPRFALTDTLRDNEKAVPRDRLTIVPGERMAAICARLDLPFVDLGPPLRAARAAAATNGAYAPLYVPFDVLHFDAEGHGAIAQAVAEALAERGISLGTAPILARTDE